MQIRWMKRKNESNVEEKFYPVTHVDAIVYGDKKTYDEIANHVDDVSDPHNINEKIDAKINAALSNFSPESGGSVGTLSDLGLTATATELNYMDGVISNVQTQFDGVQTQFNSVNARLSDLESLTNLLSEI